MGVACATLFSWHGDSDQGNAFHLRSTQAFAPRYNQLFPFSFGTRKMDRMDGFGDLSSLGFQLERASRTTLVLVFVNLDISTPLVLVFRFWSVLKLRLSSMMASPLHSGVLAAMLRY
jgi:hypothetical protein